jgi:DnaJ-class molecular chaperone
VETRVKWALEVLGVEEGASMRKITAAYRKLARTYHPDKVLELPAEAREISERRMKEINAAYSELKRRAETPRGSGGSYSPADSIHRSS